MFCSSPKLSWAIPSGQPVPASILQPVVSPPMSPRGQFTDYQNRPSRGWEPRSIPFRIGPDEEIPIVIKADIHRACLDGFTWHISGVIGGRAYIQRGSTKVNVTHPTPVCKPALGREQAPKLRIQNSDYRDSHDGWSGFWGACQLP